MRSVLSWSAVLFCARVLGAIGTYVAQILIARWLGAEALGQYVLAFSVMVVASVIATAGFAEGAPRFIGMALTQAKKGLARGYLRRARQVTLMGALLIGVFGTGMWYAWGCPDQAVILLMALALVPFFSLLRLHSAVAQALGCLALKEFLNSAFRPIMFASVVAIGWWFAATWSAHDILIVHGVIIGVVACIQIVLTSRIFRTRTTGDPVTFDDRNWFQMAPMFVISGALYTYLPELTNLVVSPFLAAGELAYLNAAMRTAMLVMFAFYAIDAAFLPRATALFANASRLELERWILQAGVLKMVVSGGMFLLTLMAGNQVLALFGPGFETAEPALQIFAAGLFLRTSVGAPLQLLILSNQQTACVIASIASLLTLAGCAAILTPMFGITGAALSTVVAMMVWALCVIGPARLGVGFHPGPIVWFVVGRLKKS